jgi:hypothetical protein
MCGFEDYQGGPTRPSDKGRLTKLEFRVTYLRTEL